MEIRDHRINSTEPVTGVNENIGVAVKGLYLARAHTRRLQRSNRRRSNGDHPTTSCTRLTYSLAHGFADLYIFLVHDMLLDLLCTHRLESTRAHMQCHRCPMDTAGIDLLQHG